MVCVNCKLGINIWQPIAVIDILLTLKNIKNIFFI